MYGLPLTTYPDLLTPLSHPSHTPLTPLSDSSHTPLTPLPHPSHTLLQAVQKMYGLPLTTYPDLLKTGEELGLLQTLYDLYQRYIDFDHK